MAKFKTRARAIEMLGRQQIAGVGNAISELFKNAYDAYADRVVVDYFASDGLLVLRDDGLGMTKEDLLERWLTVGTESKLSGAAGIAPDGPNQSGRAMTGEKGIGRLAIAALGRQVLLLSRAKRGERQHDIVAAFVHWGLFECPGINLDQIEIPVRTFQTLPNREEIKEMVNVVCRNVQDLAEDTACPLGIAPSVARRIVSSLNQFDFDLPDIASFLSQPSLKDDGHGTHFYILPASENLRAEVELDMAGKKVSKLKKYLLGFSNTMSPDSQQVPIATAFRYWPTDEQYFDLIGESEFLTPLEFEMADHHILGQFDEFGQFSGTVSIYKQAPVKHVIPWPNASQKAVACGPFGINVAYVPDLARQSKMPPQEYARLSRKLDLIGGLYIYRDGIRVLPYGDSEIDFLQIDQRKKKSASYYFFSYRRMFGAIDITRQQNAQLVDKAGREGFQENQAYREFVAILSHFFIQLAADFFREGVPLARRADDRYESVRQAWERQSALARRAFAADLDHFFERVGAGKPQEGVAAIFTALEKRLSLAQKESATDVLLEAELVARTQLADLRGDYRVERASGIGLTPELNRDFRAYFLEAELLEKTVFSPAEKRIGQIVTEAARQMKLDLSPRTRLRRQLTSLNAKAILATEEEIVDTFLLLEKTQKELYQLTSQIRLQMQQTIEEVAADLERLSEPAQIESWRMTERIELQAAKSQQLLAQVRAQLANISSQNGPTPAEITAALEEEVLVLRERYEADLELSQLGMALAILTHEFADHIANVRHYLPRLKAWANLNPGLKPIYRNIKTSFNYLETYITLLVPLNRRMYLKEIRIKGASIAHFLKKLFRDRMRRHQVNLSYTDAFRRKVIIGYPATFYPVFINLVDNAIFWLKDQPQPREILLDVRGEAFIVSDTGPGIPTRDREAIFEWGFTRKPAGRGLGLHISREILTREGFVLELDDSDRERGATFKIYRKESEAER